MSLNIKTWNRASNNLGKELEFLIPIIQGLGKLDVHLSKRYPQKEKLDKLKNNVFLSYLWILGAYEVVRTIHEKSKRKGLLVQRQASIQRLKKNFAKLRIPLAKMEYVGKEGSDLIPLPMIIDDVIGWKIKNEMITREEMSFCLFEFLLSLEIDNRCPSCGSYDTDIFGILEKREGYLRCLTCKDRHNIPFKNTRK